MQLYFGNLASEVDEPLLFELVSHIAPVSYVRMPKHKIRRTRQGYGFAVFSTEEDAHYTLEVLTKSPVSLYGRALRVSTAAHTETGASVPNTNSANASSLTRKLTPQQAVNRIYIGNLDPELTDEQSLRRPFEKFGKVLDVEIISKPLKCHAFVRLADPDTTQKAITELNGQYIMNRKVRVDLER